MGIYKLFSFIRKYLKPINIKEYEYQNCGIDGHYFLHKFLSKLGIKILEEEPDLTPIFRKFLNYLKTLKKEYNIEPFVILEGNDTPIRCEIKNNRISDREEKLKKVQELISENKFYEAKKYKIEAMSIRPYHCKQFYDLCYENGIKCMISPYEVDHQLKYLEKIKKIDFIIGNDTDLIALNCQNVVFQFNFDTLEGLRYNKNECENIFFNNNFNEERLLLQCILRGCYFYKGINEDNFDITLNILNNNNGSSHIEIIKKLLSDKSKSEIEDNIKEYEKAYISYKYGIIYDPYEKKEKYLNELPLNKKDFVYKYNFENIVGKFLPQEIIDGLVNGKINSKNLEEIKNIPKPTISFMQKYKKLTDDNDNNNNKNNYNNKNEHLHNHNHNYNKKKYNDRKNLDKNEKINYYFNKNEEESQDDSDYSTNKSDDKNYNLNYNFNTKLNLNEDKNYFQNSINNSNYNKENKNSPFKVNNNYYNNNNYQEKTKYYNKNYYQNKTKYNNDDDYHKNQIKYNYNNHDFNNSKNKKHNNTNTYHNSNNYYPKKQKKYFNSNDINNYESLYQNPIYFNKK